MPAPSPNLPPHHAWLDAFTMVVEAGGCAQFLLHGNVRDLFLAVKSDGVDYELTMLSELLTRTALASKDLVLELTPHGELLVRKGAEMVDDLPSYLPFPSGEAAYQEALRRTDEFWTGLAKHTRGVSAALIITEPYLMTPREGQPQVLPDQAAYIVREWSNLDPFITRGLVSVILTESLEKLHPALAENRLATPVRIPYPGGTEFQVLTEITRTTAQETRNWPLGATLFQANLALNGDALPQPEVPPTLLGVPAPPLKHLVGHEEVRTRLQQDLRLWLDGDLRAITPYYLICGPDGVGKQTLVEAVAASLDVPVFVPTFMRMALSTSAPKWDLIWTWLEQIASQERGILLFPNAEQLPFFGISPLYGGQITHTRFQDRLAEIMAYYLPQRRFLAFTTSSRPDLMVPFTLLTQGEDTRLPLFPTSHTHEGFRLLQSILRHSFELELADDHYSKVEENIPWLLTAAEARLLAAKTYRLVKLDSLPVERALNRAAKEHHSPLSNKNLEQQIRVAIEESDEPGFIPDLIRNHFLGG